MTCGAQTDCDRKFRGRQVYLLNMECAAYAVRRSVPPSPSAVSRVWRMIYSKPVAGVHGPQGTRADPHVRLLS